MTISNIKSITLGKQYQKWQFEYNDNWYWYVTNQAPLVHGEEVKLIQDTMLEQFDPNSPGNKGPRVLHLHEYLPLDPTNPLPGIEKLLKLLVVQ